MIDYVDEIIAEFDKLDPRGSGIKTRSIPEDIYNVEEECENLGPDKANMFHNIVSKNLYSTKWARPDTCTLVAFLTKIVR